MNLNKRLKQTHCWVTDECGNNANKAIAKDLTELVSDCDKEIIFGRIVITEDELIKKIEEYTGVKDE